MGWYFRFSFWGIVIPLLIVRMGYTMILAGISILKVETGIQANHGFFPVAALPTFSTCGLSGTKIDVQNLTTPMKMRLKVET